MMRPLSDVGWIWKTCQAVRPDDSTPAHHLSSTQTAKHLGHVSSADSGYFCPHQLLQIAGHRSKERATKKKPAALARRP
eukprot:1152248-Pelagomonas_calceolata.AAC.1